MNSARSVDRLYFIRIGGTAMGGVAAACADVGDEVFGSEQDLYEPMKSYLDEAGIHVYRSFDPTNIVNCDPDLVVVGNAVSRGNEELEAALNHRLNCISLPEIVAKKLIGKKTSVVIAGTHGKTTTTAMTANMLRVGELKPGFMIGGVPGNFEVSCLPGEGNVFVIEGDEYDSAYFDKRSKFLHYRPDIAVVNNLEFDHSDIFDDLAAIKKSFRLFIRLVPTNGVVLANGDDENVLDILKDACSPVETFGFGTHCYWRPINVIESADGVQFELLRNGESIGTFKSPANGSFNVLNMVIAIAVGLRLGMSLAQCQEGAISYKPPKRRMQEVGEWRGALVIDDFGHHPTAIKATIDALLAKYPGRRLVACFEPRSNTTTRAFFQKELTECFEKAAAVAIGALDRPQRFQPEERLDTAKLIHDFGKPGIAITIEQGQEKDWGKHIATWLETVVQPSDLLVTFSNGDFGGLRAMLR